MTQEPRPNTNLTEELNRVVNQITEAVRLAWDSDERKRLQAEITDGVKNFSVQIDEAVRKASESETAKNFKTQAEQVAVKARETDVVDDMRQGLLVGLQALNRELGKMLERLQSSPAPVSTGPVPPQAPAAPYETMTEPTASEPPADPPVEI
jgi:predicted RNA-binding Zn ribbon-like protein